MADIVPGPVSGLDCKLYYNTGTNASPTWVEITQAIDVAVPDFGVNQIAANSRGSKYESFVNGLIKLGMTFGYLHVRGTDTVRDALAGMVTGRTAKQFAAMDGDITHVGARGVKAYFNMEKFGQTQGFEGATVWDASLKPAHFIESSAKVEPAIYVVAGT
jgi:hypothetical protein